MPACSPYAPRSPDEPPPERVPVAIELLCRKIGMTRLFDEQGQCVSVTVLDAGPNAVVQKKTPNW